MKYRMKHAPMGWNSYDYYDTIVTEREVRANADYMAAHLKPYGWEYIVVDIQWYAKNTGSQREKYQYIPFGEAPLYGPLPVGEGRRGLSGAGGLCARAGVKVWNPYHAGNSAGSGTPASADFGKRRAGERYSGSVVDL